MNYPQIEAGGSRAKWWPPRPTPKGTLAWFHSDEHVLSLMEYQGGGVWLEPKIEDTDPDDYDGDPGDEADNWHDYQDERVRGA